MIIDTKNLPNDTESLQDLLRKQNSYVSHLEEQIKLLLLKRYGSRAEYIPLGQRSLFDEAELARLDQISAIIPIDNSDAATSTTTVPEHERKKRARKPLPEALERVKLYHSLSLEERTCQAHDCEMKEMGFEVSEQLDIIPAVIRVLQHNRHKYTCPKCTGNIKVAPLPAQMIPKSMASSGLLAHIAVCKYEDSLPLYRQESILERSGIELGRSTLARWMIQCGEQLTPMINLMRDELLSSQYVQCDETTIQVLKEKNRAAESKSYMWAMASMSPEKPIILYEYRASRSADTACNLLQGFKGFLQTDGFAGYNKIAANSEVSHMGCWAHARRKFFEAVKGAPKNSKDGVSKKILSLIQMLYKIERDFSNSNSEIRLKARQEKSLPILEEIKKILYDNHADVLPKSLTGKAIHYTLSEWNKLTVYTSDGNLKIDNNFIENKIRPFCIGRKNWLFADTPAGADASAAIYSIIITAKANGIDTYSYLRFLFERMPAAKTAEEYEQLLPWNFKKSFH